jgi:hypothetical protein
LDPISGALVTGFAIFTTVIFGFTILIAVTFGWDSSPPTPSHGDVLRV